MLSQRALSEVYSKVNVSLTEQLILHAKISRYLPINNDNPLALFNILIKPCTSDTDNHKRHNHQFSRLNAVKHSSNNFPICN